MDLRGRTVLVTGSTGGIGKETARGLAGLGARVLLVGRDAGRAAAAAAEIARSAGNAEVEALTADLLLQRDVRDLARRVRERTDRLHALVNNFGVLDPCLPPTEEGLEATFAANVLTPFTLTNLLLPLLREGRGRVVNVTGGIPGGAIDPDNLQGEKIRVGWTFSQYNHAKTALMAMSHEMAGRLAGTGVTVNVVYPGHGNTPGNQGLPMSSFPRAYRPVVPLLRVLGPFVLSDLAKPARAAVRLASDAGFEGVTDVYIGPGGRRTPWPESVRDPRARAAVWSLCERLGDHTAG
ncbi:SDR family NAD(P)-dependent oxidoreductase [Actinocorallia populi]|uniref:SDR family NAD(P)-dependent oxidoreductase n=1 Tax=Actinocorallia populi TaxID=2079200 RepID=UPI001E4CCAFC|nr:SDR family NAD(P)-dependent oxidoreductase [Actinocorallia populi]